MFSSIYFCISLVFDISEKENVVVRGERMCDDDIDESGWWQFDVGIDFSEKDIQIQRFFRNGKKTRVGG